MTYYLKDPLSLVDYSLDWGSGYLDGQTLIDSAWSVEPQEQGGLFADDDSFDLTKSAVRLSGGVAGHVYTVSNLVALSDGSLDRRSIHLRVERR